ncbi:helix-turn-helix domain-containing protein [Streptomyces sp. NPDC102487]|uniref:helix-turn-helix domain-containing protein n=1 Tax=Streptomyces sp. NPDC102487 TaxID=3366182 RepID=UPI003829B6C2
MDGEEPAKASSREWPTDAFARALRDARSAAGMSRTQLAHAAGLDRSVLSRLENGHYRHRLSEGSLGRLSAALSCGDALYEAGGFTLPGIRDLVSDPVLGRALSDASAARHALQRLHLAQVARSAVVRALMPDEPSVDVHRLWSVTRKQAGLAPAPMPTNGPGSLEGTVVGRRFQAAHGAAHLLLSTCCTWPYGTDAESEASELAGMLLTPPGPFTQAVRAAFTSGIDPWDPDTGGLVAAISDSLLIPGWLAAYRLADFPGIHLQLIPIDEETA